MKNIVLAILCLLVAIGLAFEVAAFFFLSTQHKQLNSGSTTVAKDATAKAVEAKVPVIKEVTVATAKEFIEVIGSNVQINITNDIDLKDIVHNYKNTNSNVASTDSDGIVINGVSNLTIKGVTKDKRTKMTTPLGGAAKVLYFIDSKNVHIQNMELGHESQTFCDGGVLRFEKCDNVTIENSDLYGCGTYGIITSEADYVIVKNSIIRECTIGLLQLLGNKDQKSKVIVDTCILKTTKNLDMISLKYIDIEIKNSEISNNKGESLIIATNSNIKLTNNKIYNNKLKSYIGKYSKDYNIEKIDNEFKGNTFTVTD